MVQSQARLRSKSSPLASVSALSRLCEAKACLRDAALSLVGSVARRCDSAAVSFRLRSAAFFWCESEDHICDSQDRRVSYGSGLEGFETLLSFFGLGGGGAFLSVC